MKENVYCFDPVVREKIAGYPIAAIPVDEDEWPRLFPRRPLTIEKEVKVGRAVYKRHKTGETVHVTLKQGWLEIPWFFVE